MEQDDIQELVNHSHDMAEKLLIHQDGEFYPFGAEIDNQGMLTNIGHHHGDDFPLSDEHIKELKKYFEQEVDSRRIRAYAITFDCLAKRDPDAEKTEAIAIECYLRAKEQRTIYYFPYRRVTSDELEFGKPWGTSAE